MFGELLESRAKPVRNRAGTTASIVGHAVAIALAVAATRAPLIARDPEARFAPLPTLELPSTARSAEQQSRRSVDSPVTEAPVPTMIDLPPIALPGIPHAELFPPIATATAWRSDSGGSSGGITTGLAGNAGDEIPFAAGVDTPALALAGNPSPRYPDILRRANVRGTVVVQVVIDTSGRADMTTLRLMSSDHPLLTDAVLAVLPRARFLPAETGGRKVRMWALQSFVFEMQGMTAAPPGL